MSSDEETDSSLSDSESESDGEKDLSEDEQSSDNTESEAEETETVTLDNLSEENLSKVTQLSELIASSQEVAFYYLNSNNWDVQNAANSFFGGDTVPSFSNITQNNNQRTTTGRGTASTYRNPFGNFGFRTNWLQRRRERRDDGEILCEFDENFHLNNLSEEDINRKKLVFYYSTHDKYTTVNDIEFNFSPVGSENPTIKKIDIDIKNLTFEQIKETIMNLEDVNPRLSSCRIADTRLWLGFKQSPFLLVDFSQERMLITDFEKKINVSMDNFHFIMENRYLTEKFPLDEYIDMEDSSWNYMKKVWREPEYVDWNGMKKIRVMNIKRETRMERQEREDYIVIECLTDKKRILDIKMGSLDVLSVPKFLFY